MQQALQRTTVRGPTFVRLLARLGDVDAAQSSQTLPDRLSQWLDWKQSITLSTALDGKPPAPVDGVPAFDRAVEDDCTRIRATLVEAITTDRYMTAVGDYKVFRQRYLVLQRSMLASTGNLRGRLRDMLTPVSDAMARLAEVDAVMEAALSPREQALLGRVPALLETHYDRLRQAAPLAGDNAPAAWLEVFRKDMQGVLLAELDVRFQPVDALLAALRT
ncbi:MAG: DUF3348 domain-containing protein [Luteibacter sp.]